MDGINVFLIAGISFLIPAILLLCGTLFFYISTKKFNKNGINIYAEIFDYEYGSTSNTNMADKEYPTPSPDYLIINFEIENKKHTQAVACHLPFFKKTLEKRYPIGRKAKN